MPRGTSEAGKGDRYRKVDPKKYAEGYERAFPKKRRKPPMRTRKKRPPSEGWWWPLNARKAHFMVEGRSLCGRWACLGNPTLEEGNNNSPDNCVACKRALEKARG